MAGKSLAEIPAGTRVIFREDGGAARCEIVANKSNEEFYALDLKVLELVQPTRFAPMGEPLVVGREFTVQKRIGTPHQSIMWEITEEPSLQSQ